MVATRTRLALGMAAFGSATPISKIVTDAMPIFVGGGLRVLLGAAVLLPFALRSTALKEIAWRDWLAIGAISLFGMFGFTAFMLFGMRMVTGVVGATVMSTTPAVTALASMIVLREKPTWRKLLAIALAVAGVLVLQIDQSETDGDGSFNMLGPLLVFGAVCCEVVYTLVGKTVSQTVPPIAAAGLSAALSVPLFAVLALWHLQDFDVSAVNARAWLALVWYGVGTLALGSWLWYSGIARAQGSVAAAFMGVMPASALVLSYFLLDESFKLLHLVGFATVFIGVLLVSWEHGRLAQTS